MTDFEFDIESYRLRPDQFVLQPLYKHEKNCISDIECTCGVDEILMDEMIEDMANDH
jgi:hypothetical protein